ncbi:FAD-dependent monooxygenase [Streptomyces sp. NPDC088194]|uniref:FAD-dependent oxidoreductase n=1 Tax=Streptomyces sp. NPDC088194 TaxID=3154931 RepID=UPI00344D6789
MTTAVVLGGGLAGLFAATVLADHADEVVVVESDVLPTTPAPRNGLPQGRHNHILMRGGAEAFDELLPGTTELLMAAGAKRRGLPGGTLTRGPRDWFQRHRTDAYLLLCGRDTLDHVVRGQVLGAARLTMRQGVKAVALTGDAQRVTGVRIKPLESGQDTREETIAADLVVDATGRRSDGPRWLAELGVAAPREDFVDAGFAYASRWYQAPEGTEDFPGVMIQVQPGTGEPGRGIAILPNDNGRWIVTRFGSRGGEPPTDEKEFVSDCGDWEDPLVSRLLSRAKPLSDIRSYRRMPNWRRHYEKLPLPEGYFVIGDAASALNPTYGTGMSVAARSALVLRAELRRTGLGPGLGRRVQRGVAKANAFAWQNAVSNDLFFPGVTSSVPVRGAAFQTWMAARVAHVAARDRTVSDIAFTVGTFCAPPSRMFSRAFMWPVIRGPRRPPLTAQQAIEQFPEFGDLLAPEPVTDPR